MPESMDQSKLSLREVFSEAAEISNPAARAAFLDSACKGDPALRSRVEQLLAADSRARNFMSDRAERPPYDLDAEKIGERIGRYRLVERIGRGGFGTVYLAEQEEPVRRFVALKVLKLGMDTHSVVARFEAERQALALMDHPNIAKVLDAGATEAGRPFFVMELVRGMAITTFCDHQGLSVRQRIELFVPVCHAIQHAHQKGIIHRDLKPSNILVVAQDGIALPKVIDFGIAKATGQGLENHGGLTSENQFLGTPAYMSPEQVGLGGCDVDTRTDIYSLGVILYELVTGQPPFHPADLVQAGLDEMRRIIREVDPPRPSTTITKNLNRNRLPSATKPSRERLSAVRGDMDWIVMKCLEKERGRRYEAADGLAMDLRRHLENEPVVARPPSQLYRLQKTIRRHRLAFSAAGSIALVLVAAAIVSSQLALRARRAEHEQSSLRGLAETKAEESRQRLIRRYVGEGNRLMEEGLPLLALPWMVEALSLESGDPQREADERLRIAQARVGTPALRLHLSQGKQVQCVSLSPDGNRLAAGSEDGIVRICSVATGGDAGTNVMMFSAVLAVRFSPDGERVVAVEKSGQARVWNAASGQAVTPPFQPEDFNPTSIGEVGSWLKPSVEFSPDGRFFLLSFGSNSAELRDAADGKLLRRFTHGKVVYHATFSPDAQWVVTSSKDATACVWETATGKLAAPPLQHSDIVTRAQFSSDAQKLMTVRNRHFVQLWDWRTGERLGKELPRRSELSHASLSPDDRKVLTTAWSGFAHLYDAASSLIINEFVHEGGLVDAAFSPDGHYAAIACHDGNVWLWDVYDRRRRPMLLPQGNQIEQISFNHDGRFLAVGTRGGHARVWELFPPERGVQRLSGKDVQWVEFDSSGNRALILSTGEQSAWSNYDVQSGQLMSTAALSPSDARCVRFSPDGKRILAYGSGRRVLVFDSATGRQTVKPLGHSQRVTDALWSADGKLIVTVAGAARAWNPDTGQTAVTFAHSNSVRAIALSADGARLATGHADKSVVLWRTANGEREGFPLTGFGSIRELHFTPDGRRLGIATSGQSGEGIVEVRGLASGKVIGAPLQHRDAVTSFAFSPNGKMIATGCNDHSVRVWDVATGEPISPWLRHDFEARLVVFSPDGTRLATIARRGAVRLWSTRTGEPITAPIVYLRNTGNGHVSYSPDGRRLLLSRGGNEAFLRDLQPEAAGVEELRLLSEVLTCTRFDPAAGMVPLDEVALNDAWKQLRILRAGN